jgi:hypothetical protein
VVQLLMKTALLAAALTLFVCLNVRAQDPAAAGLLLQKMLLAETSKDYGSFAADGTDQLKAALTATQFDAVANLMNPRLLAGYVTTFLGDLNQRGFEVYLYRLRFKDGGDDVLATLSVKDAKVGGIYFK